MSPRSGSRGEEDQPPERSFDALHPALQFHVVNSLGWRSLRPLQERAIPPILAGEHVLLAAPTAGGKTEAAVFPLLSRLLEASWSGLSILYLCPLKALLNDLEPRLAGYARLLGRHAALWHGDVGQGERRRIRREPPEILLTTPESIEVLLGSRAASPEAFFGGVRAVVVDELHAFAGDDRGWHLLALLERLGRIAAGEIQRVGLSATLGNPQELAEWMAGSSTAPRRALVEAGTEEDGVPDLRVDAVGTTENAALVISRLHRGEKRLVFCDSRSRVEDLAYALRNHDVQAWVSHSSLSLDDRRQAERAFAEGSNCVIVATSTLELGIDVGDLDRVLQIEAPPRVASFLQRLGRTGRRSGSRRNMLFLTTGDTGLLVALALLRLWRRGYVEPLEPPPLPFHVVVQQILGLVRQQGALARGEWRQWIGGLPGLRDLDEADVQRLLRHLEDAGWLFADGGVVGFGPAADRRFAGKGLLDLFSVFSSDPLFSVRHGNVEIGKVDEASFLQERPDGALVLLLGGRAWQVGKIDWQERRAYVKPIEVKGRSLWPGEGQPLSYELCRALRDVLVRPLQLEEGAAEEDAEEEGTAAAARPLLTRRGQKALEDVRGRYHWLPKDDVLVLHREGNRKSRLWTFAGLRANAELAGRLRAAHIGCSSVENLAIVFEEHPLPGEVEEALREETPPHWLHASFLESAIEGLKLSECLPRELAEKTIRARMSDPRAVEETAARWVVGAGS